MMEGVEKLKVLQMFAKQFHSEMGWEVRTETYDAIRSSLLNNYMLLTTEVSEVAEELRKLFNQTHKSIQDGTEDMQAFNQAKEQVKENVGKELADCLAYILKLANFFECDLEESFYQKMAEVKSRVNKDIPRK